MQPRLSKGERLRAAVRRVKKKIKKASLPIVASLVFWSGIRTPPADASTAPRAVQQRMATPNTEGGDSSPMSFQTQDTSEAPSKSKMEKKSAKKKAKNNSVYGDLEDEDFDEDEFADLEDDDSSKKATTSTKVTEAEIARARAMQTNTAQQQYMAYKKKDPYLKLKVGAAVFIPSFGGQSFRELYRRRKEERYVQKGLEIMRAQEAEYFNITNTTADSDVEDELKKLKDDEDDDDDDDDDSDDEDYDDEDDSDDDDDDEDEDDDRRRKPKRPTRGGGPRGDGGDSSGSGGDNDPGHGKPSDEDTERLNNLFNKS